MDIIDIMVFHKIQGPRKYINYIKAQLKVRNFLLAKKRIIFITFLRSNTY